MLFHFPVDAHVIFCTIELTLEALFKNMTRFWNGRSTILFVPTLKLEMSRSYYQVIVEFVCETVFRFDWKMFLEQQSMIDAYLVYFIPNEHTNKLWVMNFPSLYERIHKIYIFFHESLIYWRFYLSPFPLNL